MDSVFFSIISFFSRSVCGSLFSYDYVMFWKDANRTASWHPDVTKYSGTGNTGNFPGFGGRPPLVIDSGRYCVHPALFAVVTSRKLLWYMT